MDKELIGLIAGEILGKFAGRDSVDYKDIMHMAKDMAKEHKKGAGGIAITALVLAIVAAALILFRGAGIGVFGGPGYGEHGGRNCREEKLEEKNTALRDEIILLKSFEHTNTAVAKLGFAVEKGMCHVQNEITHIKDKMPTTRNVLSKSNFCNPEWDFIAHNRDCDCDDNDTSSS